VLAWLEPLLRAAALGGIAGIATESPIELAWFEVPLRWLVEFHRT
jgi:hypothetical protein